MPVQKYRQPLSAFSSFSRATSFSASSAVVTGSFTITPNSLTRPGVCLGTCEPDPHPKPRHHLVNSSYVRAPRRDRLEECPTVSGRCNPTRRFFGRAIYTVHHCMRKVPNGATHRGLHVRSQHVRHVFGLVPRASAATVSIRSRFATQRSRPNRVSGKPVKTRMPVGWDGARVGGSWNCEPRRSACSALLSAGTDRVAAVGPPGVHATVRISPAGQRGLAEICETFCHDRIGLKGTESERKVRMRVARVNVNSVLPGVF